MTARPRSELGGLLEVLHGAAKPFSSVEATYQVWRHNGRAGEARAAEQRQDTRGSSFFAVSSDDLGGCEVEEVLRIWLAGDRAREEHYGGPDAGAYGVRIGDLWWTWHERDGARSNQTNPKFGSSIGKKPAFMMNPTPLLGALKFAVVGRSQIAGRATITADAAPRPNEPARSAYELGWGADQYRLEVDALRGVLLEVRALRDGEDFQRTTTTEITFDAAIPEELFRFATPAGEPIQPVGPPTAAESLGSSLV